MPSDPKYRHWTFTDELILLKNWNGSKSVPLISELLNFNSNRVLEKAHILRLDARGKNIKWSDSEMEFLESIAETSTLDQLVEKYNLRVKQEKNEIWQYRTKKSIKKKLFELGYSAKPLVGYVTLTELGRYLGRTHRYMLKLVEEKKLEVNHVGKKYHYVSEKDFTNFAKKYPYDVGEKMTKEGMIWFLQIIAND